MIDVHGRTARGMDFTSALRRTRLADSIGLPTTGCVPTTLDVAGAGASKETNRAEIAAEKWSMAAPEMTMSRET